VSYGVRYALCLDRGEYVAEASPWSPISYSTGKRIEELIEHCEGLLVIGDTESYSVLVTGGRVPDRFATSVVKNGVKVLKK